MSASVRRATDRNIEGVEIAPAGHKNQTRYSWCVFYRFPYHWETGVLGQSVADATVSCSEDFRNFTKVAGVLWAANIDKAKREIDEDCKRILKSPLMIRAVRKFAAALRQKPVLTQAEIYDLWRLLCDEDAENLVDDPRPGS